jgi:hypothetical protein
VADLLEHMAEKGATMVVPSLRPQDASMERRPFCDPENFSSGYIMRSQDILFKQGDREPWIHMLEYHQERDTCRRQASMTGPSPTPEPLPARRLPSDDPGHPPRNRSSRWPLSPAAAAAIEETCASFGDLIRG